MNEFKKLSLFILAFLIDQAIAFGAAQPAPVNAYIQRSPMDKLTIRLRQQNIQIQRDEKVGKLTKAQAKTLKAQVEAIRQQEIADLKQNGTKTLTDSQVSTLNQQLNTLSKSILVR